MSYNRNRNRNKAKPKPKKIVAPQITKEGSLGLLALGDVGLDMWRNVRDAKQ